MNDLFLWREPLWLLLTFLPAFLWILKTVPRRQKNLLHNYADEHLLARLIHNTNHSKFHLTLFTTAWLLACIALAGPFLVENTPQANQKTALDIALVIDISPSMTATDTTPNRLQRGRWELERLIQQRPHDRFSLISFSANAYITLPLTYDKNTLRHFLSALGSELPGRKGSNLGRALELAQRTLANSHADSRAIILITDGEAHNSQNLALARQLGEQKIPLLIWGVGTTTGAPIKNEQGSFIYENNKPVISRLQRSELLALAQASYGTYTDTHNDDSDLTLIEARLQQFPSLNRYQEDSRYTQQLFPWFLIASLALFSVIIIRHVPILAILSVLAFMLPTTESLADSRANQALTALQRGDYKHAGLLYSQLGNTYDAYLGQGVIAYRRQQWQQAKNFFTKALNAASNDQERAKAAYNLGNAYARQNELQHASDAFEKALHWQNNYPRASFNLNLVNQALALKPNQDAPDNSRSNTFQDTSASNDNSNKNSDAASSPFNQNPPETTAKPTPTQTTFMGDANDVEKQNPNAPQGINVDNLQEDARTLLQKRFAMQDRTDQLNRIEDKPW